VRETATEGEVHEGGDPSQAAAAQRSLLAYSARNFFNRNFIYTFILILQDATHSEVPSARNKI